MRLIFPTGRKQSLDVFAIKEVPEQSFVHQDGVIVKDDGNRESREVAEDETVEA